jgi:signal peptidase II
MQQRQSKLKSSWKKVKSIKLQACLLPLLWVTFIIGADQLTKFCAERFLLPIQEGSLYPYGGIGVFRFFGIDLSLVFTVNLGAAWSFFYEYPFALTVIRIILIMIFSVWLVLNSLRSVVRFCLYSIWAGAVGNLIDALRLGFVRDMIFFEFWGYPYAIFNLADVAICLGAVGFLIQYLKDEQLY